MDQTRTGAVVVVASTLLMGGTEVGAAPAPAPEREQHCEIEVLGVRPDGELITSELECYPTLAQALAEAGPPPPTLWSSLVATIGSSPTLSAAAGTIAVHYDGANRSGSSITVSGSGCTDGYLNLSADWINRISSTLNYCTTRFFDGYDKGGGHETTTTSTVNLGSLNNASNSIYYES